jgi:hypothetical protein
MVAPVGLGTDCRACRGANHRANRGATAAANCGAYAGANTGAHKRAADRIILCTGSGGHGGESSQRRKSEKGLPHGILHKC